jgi:hypothetical protein
MSISAISSGNVAATYTPPVQQQLPAKAPQKASTADTVTISKHAQLLANDGDTQAQEVREGAAEKAGETLRGRA